MTEVAARPPGRRPPAGVVAAALPVCALLVLPVAYLVARAAGADAESWDLIIRPRTAWLAARTAALTGAVTVAAVAIGVPMAWLTARTDLPLRRTWAVLGALPLVIPSYVGAFTILSALGPRGLLQQALSGPFGVQRLPDISGFPGAFLTLTLFTFPYVYLTTAAAIRGLDPALEDAARSLGHSRWTTFRRVTLPLLRPSIGAGALLVALYTLHDFGAVSLMRFPVFTQAIYLQYRAAFDRTPAAILSLLLLAMALVVVALERRARGRARLYRAEGGSPRPPHRVTLGRWRWPAVAFCALVAAFSLAVPLSVLGYWLARGLAAGQRVQGAWSAAGGSMAVSGAGAALGVAAALPIAVLSARYRGLALVPSRLAYAAFALPGLVVALAFVFFASSVTPALYQTFLLLVLAYVVLFLPQAGEPLRSSLLQVNERIEEAGRSLGRGRLEVFRRLTLPLVSRGAMTGFGLVFLTAMKELPATLLLRPTGFETLATRVWTHASVAQYARAAAPALLLVAVSAIPLWILARRLEVQEVRKE